MGRCDQKLPNGVNLLPTSIDITHEGGMAVQEVDNADLVALALDGGPESFGPIIVRYKDAVFGVALARLRNFHDAEDLAQTTFVEAFDRLRNEDPERLGAWLRTITIHRCINFMKRRSRIVDFEAVEEPVTESPSPDVDFERKRLRERLIEAVGTIKRRLHDARKRLKQDMMDMVKDVLKDNAPNEEMADKVFNLLCAYPSGGFFGDPKTIETLGSIGVAGMDGFTRAMELPHWRSRRLTVHYLGREYGLWKRGSKGEDDDGPPESFAFERLKEALNDINWGIRKAVVKMLMRHPMMTEDERAERVIPLLIPMLSDPSNRVRSAVAMSLCFWIKNRASKELVRQAIPLPQVCKAAALEKAPRNLGRFRWLLGLLAKAHETE